MSKFGESALEEHVLAELAKVGWETAHGLDLAPDGPHAERTDWWQVVLAPRVEAAIRALNPQLTDEAVTSVMVTVTTRELPSLNLENVRRYEYLTQGVPVYYEDAAIGWIHGRAQLIDWDNPMANDLLAVSQFTVKGPKHTKRPDVVCFVNGLPLVLFELKNGSNAKATVEKAHSQVETYKTTIPDLFIWNQACVISDVLSQTLMGSFTANQERYAAWKTVDGSTVVGDGPHDGKGRFEGLIHGFMQPGVLLDWVHHFVSFTGTGDKLIKKVAAYHQYWAVKKAVEQTRRAVAGDGRVGVVWHTQGSGKSLEMLFYAGLVMRDPALKNPTIVVLTDRNDLDDQLFEETFAPSYPQIPLPEPPTKVDSRDQLKDVLGGRQSGGIVFSTIQKFGLSKAEKDAGTKFPLLTDRQNVIVMVDEAHRSNYDLIDGFAAHLRDALPGASFIGFTGTPVEDKDRSTKNIFGNYIDVYDLTQAVNDGATVTVFYEARLAKVKLEDAAKPLVDDALKEAGKAALEDELERGKSRWSRLEAIVGSPARIKQLAADIVGHWETRRATQTGKGMIVTMSRRIAVALYDEIVALRPDWHDDADDKGKLKVVITGSSDDPQSFQPHIRNKADRRDMKQRASDPSDELELVIVRDMWLTGFDSPSMHTMYVDKPMSGAPLMQAIARVNRVFKDKPSGLIVDYIGIAENLSDALGTYSQRDRDGKATGADIRDQAVPPMLAEHDVVASILSGVKWREALAAGTTTAFIDAVADSVSHLTALVDTDAPGEPDDKKITPRDRFLRHTSRLVQLFVIASTTEEAQEIRDDVAFFDAVRATIKKNEAASNPDASDAALDTAIRQIVSQHMASSGVIDIYAEAGITKPDISLIDDEFVAKALASPRPDLQLELLRRLLAGEVKTLGKRNKVRGKAFSDMLAEAVKKYTNRTLDTAEVMLELAKMAKEMKAESARGQLLGLSDSELAFYDALAANDSASEVLGDKTLAAIAHELMKVVRRDAKTDWAVREQVRAKLRRTIKMLLRRFQYPPDGQEAATELVMEQAELLSDLIQDEDAA